MCDPSQCLSSSPTLIFFSKPVYTAAFRECTVDTNGCESLINNQKKVRKMKASEKNIITVENGELIVRDSVSHKL